MTLDIKLFIICFEMSWKFCGLLLFQSLWWLLLVSRPIQQNMLSTVSVHTVTQFYLAWIFVCRLVIFYSCLCLTSNSSELPYQDSQYKCTETWLQFNCAAVYMNQGKFMPHISKGWEIALFSLALTFCEACIMLHDFFDFFVTYIELLLQLKIQCTVQPIMQYVYCTWDYITMSSV